jgi:hypothetical protein
MKRAVPFLRRAAFKQSLPTVEALNRAELGEFDALVLGFFLIGHEEDKSFSLTSAFTEATLMRL